MKRSIAVTLMAALLGLIAGSDSDCFLRASGSGTVDASGDGGTVVVVP